MERGNPRTDVKGKTQTAETVRREYQCSHGDRLSRSSEEISVMEMERRARDYPAPLMSQL
jgi:hypothetical protein